MLAQHNMCRPHSHTVNQTTGCWENVACRYPYLWTVIVTSSRDVSQFSEGKTRQPYKRDVSVRWLTQAEQAEEQEAN